MEAGKDNSVHWNQPLSSSRLTLMVVSFNTSIPMDNEACDMLNNSARIIVRTLFMEIIPNNIMGRVQTIFGVYTRAMMLTSALLAGWITENMDPYAGMNFASAHYLIALMGILIIINYTKFKEEVFSSNKNA